MRKRRQELYDSGPIDDGMNDRLIIVGVVAVNLCFVPVNSMLIRHLDDSDCPIPNCHTPAGGPCRHDCIKNSTTFYIR